MRQPSLRHVTGWSGRLAVLVGFLVLAATAIAQAPPPTQPTPPFPGAPTTPPAQTTTPPSTTTPAPGPGGSTTTGPPVAPQGSAGNSGAGGAGQVGGSAAGSGTKTDQGEKTFMRAVAEEILKFISGVLLLLVTWTFGQLLVARWEVYKKQKELDVALSKDLQKLVGDFKQIAREWGHRRPAATADDRKEFVGRAAAAESAAEAVLLKIVTDDEPTPQQLASLGLFRVAFRRLRETIKDGTGGTPEFQDPGLWLFNRVVADVSALVAGRPNRFRPTLRWRRRQPAPARGAADTPAKRYLRLIAVRQADWQMEEWKIADSVQAYVRDRRNARRAAIKQNVEQEFGAPGATWEWVTQETDPVPAGATVAIAILDDAADGEALARALLAQHADLTTLLAIGERSQTVVVYKSGPARHQVQAQPFEPLETLPANLVPGGAAVTVSLLLTWQSPDTLMAQLDRIAQ